MSFAYCANAQEIAYSKQLLKSILPPGQDVDTSYLLRGLDMSPGIYEMDIEINGISFHKRKVKLREYNGKLEPVFTFSDLQGLPFKEKVLSKFAHLKPETELFPIYNYYESVSAEIDVSSQVLKLSIPQLFLADSQGWVDIAPQELWDNGETGAMFNYHLTGSQYEGRHGDNTKLRSLSGTLNAQMNMGPWRLYSSGALNITRDEFEGVKSSDQEWDLWNTYLQRDVNVVQGSLQFGEINTSGEIFDSISMRGVRLSTNEMMLSTADRSYAPIIEGVANSNAKIIIRQNGRMVYTSNVAPGPLRLDKLPSFGSEGDLEVVIREADGSERVMFVPYSSIPMMLKEGQYRYDINVGQYYRHNMGPGIERKFFSMGTLAYGLPHAITLYGGILIADKYYSGAFGAGLSLGRYGALSVDATQSKAFQDPTRGIDEDLNGTAWRFRYEKTMLETGTTINLANYHYLTGHYRTFNEIAEHETLHYVPVEHAGLKSRWQLALTQSLGSWGSINGGMTYTSYKGGAQDTKSINLGYSTNIKGVGVYLNYGRNYEERSQKGWMDSHTVMLNVNIPLSLFFSGSAYSALSRTDVQYQGSMDSSINGDRTYQQRVMLNGYSDDNKWMWSVGQTLGQEENRESSVRVGYNGSDVGGDISYAYSKFAHSYQVGVNGALILHEGGITPARYAYGSVALVEVPDVEGVRLNNSFDTETNSSGYAALTYLTNYMRNDIEIDPATLPEGVLLLENTNRVVYPTAGSIVKVKYPVRFGKQALFYLKMDGTALPFGTKVVLVDENGNEDPHVQGLVGESGRVYLTALPKAGVLKAKVDGKELKFNYELKDLKPSSNPVEIPRLYLDSNGSTKATSMSYEKKIIENRPLHATKVRSFSNNKFYFLLKDIDGRPLDAGTLVRYIDDIQISEGRVSDGGYVFMSHIPASGVLYVGDTKYVY